MTTFIPNFLRLKRFLSQFLIAIGIFVFSCPSYGLTSLAHVKKSINYLVRLAGTYQIAVEVKSLTTNQMIYYYHNDKPYIPASNLKLFTAVAALEYLGVNFNYQTSITGSAALVNQGVYRGNLYVNFSGDPSLTSEDIVDLFHQLSLKGIKKIEGNIYINDNFFDQKTAVLSAMPEDRVFCYAAPTTANIINENCNPFLINATYKDGQLAQITSQQPAEGINIVNQVITRQNRKNHISVKFSNNRYFINGSINANSKPLHLSLPAQNPLSYTKGIIKFALQNNHMAFNGKIIRSQEQLAQQGELLAVHSSEPLSLLVKHMLKYSDNLYANALLKTLGARYFNRKGSWTNGSQALLLLLAHYNHLNLTVGHIVGGSGLSRLNRITTSEIIELLSSVYHNPFLFTQLREDLPTSGVDGTLKHRLTSVAYRDRVYGKTGTMSGISALSGYIKTHNNQILAFSILINGKKGKLRHYREIQDKICRVLILQR